MNEAAPKLEQGPKFVSPEQVQESIEKAKELYSEVMKFHGVEIIGSEAIPTKDEVEALAVELTEELKNIPRAECMPNGLPDHPNAEKNEFVKTTFPTAADSGYAHTLDYVHAANDNNYPRVDQEQAG